MMRPETGRAVLAATAAEPALSVAPPMSLLVDRITAASIGGPNGSPTLTLLRPPQPPTSLIEKASRPAAVAVLGAHGGAGVTCLLRAGLRDVGALDADRDWPATGGVLVVARTSTHGLERARDLARRHAAGAAGPAVRLLGLVLVADAPGRLPRRLRDLADLVSGGFPRIWQIPWLPEWRLAAAVEPLPPHPELVRLVADLRSQLGLPA